MGLDARDSRLNIGSILGDDNIPDEEDERDETCVWLDFTDSAFSDCKDNTIDTELTEHAVNPTGKFNQIRIDYPSDNVFNNKGPCKKGCCRGRTL